MALSEVDRGFVAATHALDSLRYEVNVSIRPVLERSASKDTQTRVGCLHGLSVRAVAWLASFRQLDRGEHLQAHFAGVRSLLETLVDMLLVSQDATDESAKKMNAWEQSALLEHMAKCESYYTTASGGSIIMATGPSVKYTDWLIKNRQHIANLREAYLGGTTHPNYMRWTGKKADGRNRRLIDDVKQVEAEALKTEKPRDSTNPLGVFPLEKTYTLFYAPLNWGTHGSTLALLGRLDKDGVTRTASAAHFFAAELVVHIFKVLLRACGLAAELDRLSETAERILTTLEPHIRAGNIGLVL